MDRNVERVVFNTPKKPKATKVAAYARVSSGKDAMLHSLSAQVSYYSNLIQNHEGWLYVGVYRDEGITGTKEQRNGFQRLMNDCRAGKIDLIITKSISRFARNTVTLLEAVRELKSLGIGILFEEQNINTLTAEGEFMITILASYAQEESLSASENQKWRVKKNFEEGKPWTGKMLGYRYDHGTYRVIPEEAETVKLIFSTYLKGKGIISIVNMLNAKGIPSPNSEKWSQTTVRKILSQYTYTGNLLLQRFYRNNHLEKITMVNHGELPMYHVEGCHEPIIPLEEFTAVQNRLAEQAEKFNKSKGTKKLYPFTGRVVCAGCGKNFKRRTTPTTVTWVCPTYNSQGKSACDAKQIPEETLIKTCKEVLGVEDITTELLYSRLTAIRADKNNTLIFCFRDGKEIVKRWKDRSRSESWTPEMRAEVSRRRRESMVNG